MKKQIAVVGRGKFAQAFLEQTLDSSVEMVPWDRRGSSYEGVIHAGSGRQLPEVIEELNSNHRPLIQASTHLELPYPKEIAFAWIEAPNLSLFIAKLFHVLEKVGPEFRSFDKKIEESHQSTKTKVSDTAVRFAQFLDVNPKEIVSIRDPKEQIQRGVPQEYLGGHAYHDIRFLAPGGDFVIQTHVNGRQTYVAGALEISAIWTALPHGLQSIMELIEQGVL